MKYVKKFATEKDLDKLCFVGNDYLKKRGGIGPWKKDLSKVS